MQPSPSFKKANKAKSWKQTHLDSISTRYPMHLKPEKKQKKNPQSLDMEPNLT